VLKDTFGIAQQVGHQHDWNRMEILAIDNRIRHVVNGRLVCDWSDPFPDRCGTGPIGLQLHSNQVPQEVQWRGLVVTENPENRLVTATSRDMGLIFDGVPAESGMDGAKLDLIHGWSQQLVDTHQAAGVVTLVARRGRVVHFDATGRAALDGDRPMQRETVFAIASMTKPITAAALMILQDERKLQLDEPVSKYLPEFKDLKMGGGVRPAHEFTLRHCLNHTNGLVGEQLRIGELAAAVEPLAQAELAFAPGTRYQYGAGLSVVGRVVEVVSGQRFEDFLSDRIFRPLQMNETTFRPSSEQQQRMARLYEPRADGQGLQPSDHWLFDFAADRAVQPSGGLFSTAADIARFHQMMLNGGELQSQRILSSSAVRQMTSIQTGNIRENLPPGAAWGLGFSVVHTSTNSHAASSPGAFGHGGAFGTVAWADPRQELFVVLMVARQNFGDQRNLRAELQKLARGAVIE